LLICISDSIIFSWCRLLKVTLIVVTNSKAISMVINLFNWMNNWRLSVIVTLASTFNHLLLSLMLIWLNLCHRRRYCLRVYIVGLALNDNFLLSCLFNGLLNLLFRFFNMNFFLFMLSLENLFLLFDLFKLLESVLQLSVDTGRKFQSIS
jgi:hypothetical protein